MRGLDLERFRRQIKILGPDGQRKLEKATVLIAGLGGLGSPVTLYLAAAGVGKLILVDSGRLELSNLNRQILYSVNDLGKLKVEAAARRVNELNPETKVEVHAVSVTDSAFWDIASASDVLVDCLDNWEGRLALDRVSWLQRKPLIHGGISEFYGQLTTVIPGITPCLKCILRMKGGAAKPPQVLGPTAGVVGALEAAEVIKVITGIGEPLTNRILLIDLKRMEFNTLKLSFNTSCECWET